MLDDQSDVLLKVLEVLALSHQVEVAQRSEVGVLDLADSADESQFLGKVPSYFDPRALATSLEALELLHHVPAFILYLDCPIFPTLGQVVQDRVVLLYDFSSVALHVQFGLHPYRFQVLSELPQRVVLLALQDDFLEVIVDNHHVLLRSEAQDRFG